MHTTRYCYRWLVLLLVLTLLPIAAQAAPTGRIYNLTQLFGLRNAEEVCYFGRARVAVISDQEAEGGAETTTVTFISLADESVTGQATLDGPHYVYTPTIEEDRLCLRRDVYDGDGDRIAWEDTLIAQDGSLRTREQPVTGDVGYLLPGGALIVEESGSLFLRAAGAAERKPLLISIPYPEHDDSPDPLDFRFFTVLDDHRFVYYRIGWDGSTEGCGEYDLTTGESRRLDEWGWPCLLYDGKLYTTHTVVDLETYQAEPVPIEVQGSMNLPGRKWTLSGDGRLLCELLEPPSFPDPGLRFYAMDTGENLGTLDIGLCDWGYPLFIAPDTVGIVGLTEDDGKEILLVIARL